MNFSIVLSYCLLLLGGLGATELILIVALPILLVIHFIPSIIARKRPDFVTVLLVNILTGWSIIGWVGALYLSLRKIPVHNPTHSFASSGAPTHFVADELAKLRDLRDQGAITTEEFERQKVSLLG